MSQSQLFAKEELKNEVVLHNTKMLLELALLLVQLVLFYITCLIPRNLLSVKYFIYLVHY
jgi:hypothetical protein